jgi:hypothetical protein
MSVPINQVSQIMKDVQLSSTNEENIEMNNVDANLANKHNNSIIDNLASDFLNEINKTTTNVQNIVTSSAKLENISPNSFVKLQKEMMERTSTISFGSKVVGSITKGIDSLLHTQ